MVAAGVTGLTKAESVVVIAITLTALALSSSSARRTGEAFGARSGRFGVNVG